MQKINWGLFAQPQGLTSLAYFATFILLGMVTSSMGPSLPFLAQNTQTALGNMGIVFSARAGGYLSGSLLSGEAYDRYPGHRILTAMLLWLALVFCLVPLLRQLWLLVVIIFWLGFAEGAVDVGGNTLLLWLHTRNVGPYMNALHAFFGLGSFISPLILAQVIQWQRGIGPGYFLIAAAIAPILIWVWRLPSPTISLRAPTAPDSNRDRPRNEAMELVFLVALFLFLYVGVEVGFSGWLYTYAYALELATETSAAVLTAMFWGAFTLTRLVSIPLATKVSPHTIVLFGLGGGTLSLLVILSFPASAPGLWAGTLGLGASIASVFPSAISFVENQVPLTGKLTRWFFVGASLGAMILPWLLGKLFAGYGAPAVMQILFVVLLCAGVLFVGIVRKEKKGATAIHPSLS